MFFQLPRIPDFRLPGFIKTLHQHHLPQWPHSLSICAALNLAAHLKVLPEDLLPICEGRSFMMEIEDAGTQAHFTCRQGRFIPGARSTDADVCFRGALHAYLKLLTRQEDPDTLFFNRALALEGDTELGLAIKNLLDALEWPPAHLPIPALPELALPKIRAT